MLNGEFWNNKRAIKENNQVKSSFFFQTDRMLEREYAYFIDGIPIMSTYVYKKNLNYLKKKQNKGLLPRISFKRTKHCVQGKGYQISILWYMMTPKVKRENLE